MESTLGNSIVVHLKLCNRGIMCSASDGLGFLVLRKIPMATPGETYLQLKPTQKIGFI
jgi:hypothetical protein